MQILETLCGSPEHARALVLFVFNPEKRYSLTDISKLTGLKPKATQTFIKELEKSDLIETRVLKNDEQGNRFPRPTRVWNIKTQSPFYQDLNSLCHKAAIPEHKTIVNILNKYLKVKVVVLGGFFLGTDRKMVDILVVGDSRGSASAGEKAIQALEKLINRELVYTTFSQDEYTYRLGMRDRHLREIIDAPHQTILGEFEL